MVSNYHTHPNLARLTKNRSIHIHLIARCNQSCPGFPDGVLFGEEMEWFAVWNSSSNTRTFCTTWVADFCGLLCLATFLLCYILHAIIESTSKISFPTCWTNIRYHTRSTNSLYLTPWASKLMPNWTQTSRVALHSQKRCPLFSLPNPHASHISSSITY